MTHPRIKSETHVMHKQTMPPPLFLSSSSFKVAAFAILALLFLNLNASSVIYQSSNSGRGQLKRRQQPSLKPKKNKQAKQSKLRPQSQQSKQDWKVLEQYEQYEAYSGDSVDVSFMDEEGNAWAEDGAIVAERLALAELRAEEEEESEGGEVTDAEDDANEGEERTDDGAVEEAVEEKQMINEKARRDEKEEKMIRKIREKKESGRKGKISWLMSFPNSGTSFTSLLIRHASNATTATNYGMESRLGENHKSVPVYDWSVTGPYWLHPPQRKQIESDADAKNADSDAMDDDQTNNLGKDYKSGTKLGKSGAFGIPPESASIMTKTHCGSRCAFCPPSRYLETSVSFLKACFSGSRKVPIKQQKTGKQSASSMQYEKQEAIYHPAVVESAVHLIRNPFDNLVSRFHHEQKEHAKKNATIWTSRYSNNVHGFKKWCADQDALYAEEERSVDWNVGGYPADITQYFNGVACHAEFFRYVQWHVLSLRTVEILDIPVLYVYYEDYSKDLQKSTREMLDFLKLEQRVEKLPYFDSNKDYSEYFTQEERAAASDLMRRLVLASSNGSGNGGGISGKELLERYWNVEFDYDKLRAQTKSIK